MCQFLLFSGLVSTIEYLLMGGPLFMGILTVIFIFMVTQIVRGFLKKPDGENNNAGARKTIELIKSIALLGLTFGFLGNLIGFYTAFDAIETRGVELSTGVLAGGLKVSLFTPLYGLIIFIIGRIAAMILEARA